MRNLLRHHLILSAVAAGAVSCGEPFKPLSYELGDGASVRITVPPGDYHPGDLIPLTVHNLSDAEYVWNPCCRGLERQIGAKWVSLEESDRFCPLVGWMLDPGDRTEATTDLAASMPQGEYRLLYGFSRESGNYNVSDYQVSNSFTITP